MNRLTHVHVEGLKSIRKAENVGGQTLASRIAGRIISLYAPYFASIRPRITTLEPGRCQTEMSDRRSVRNHLGSIHAIAVCNLIELTMGLTIESALPDHLRWIAKGMEVKYLKKARNATGYH